ncbi:MAG: zinc ABC transporter substrate-binding protein [Muribaculaceae bacterium]|nr:zinc ABC transporter substrate-binding protein [Muribaculaceae bacterium]
MLLLTAWGCGAESDRRPVIAVSFDSQREIVERIAGEGWQVVSLMPPGSDPEMFDPDMRTMKGLERAEVYMTTSTLGFEQQTGERIRANYPSLPVVDLTEGIDILMHTHEVAGASAHADHDRLPSPHDDGDEVDECHSHGAGSHQVGDPHLLSSLRNARRVARNVTEALCRLRPDSAAIYRSRFHRLDTELEHRDHLTDSLLTASGAKGGTIVVMHPSLSYYARDYGLVQLPLEADGKEASPRQLEQRLQLARQSRARALFYERGHSEPQARQIAAELHTGAFPVMLNGSDFLSRIDDVTRAVAAGSTQQK